MSGHAEYTRCPIRQTKGDIEAILGKYGATGISVSIKMGGVVHVWFGSHGRDIRFRLPMPWPDEEEQAAKSAMRKLYRCIEGKLISSANNIESFEEAFMPQIVMADGRTLAETILPTLPRAEPLPERIKCRFCGRINRVPPEKSAKGATCGQCHRPLVSNLEAAEPDVEGRA